MPKPPPRRGRRDLRRLRSKPSILTTDKIEYIDYKDVGLLSRFISDRSKIRSRKISGNNVRQQKQLAKAIKNAREMALIPYATRTVSQKGARGSYRYSDMENETYDEDYLGKNAKTVDSPFYERGDNRQSDNRQSDHPKNDDRQDPEKTERA